MSRQFFVVSFAVLLNVPAPAQTPPGGASQPFAAGPPLKLTPNGKTYGDTVRWFDLKTGEPKGSIKVEGMTHFLNDIEVAQDGTIYATQTGDQTEPTWRLYKITPDGKATILVSGAPLKQPNGVAFDPKGNIVVVQCRDKRCSYVLSGRPASSNGAVDRPGKRRTGDSAGRHEVHQ